jgi:hypothetical protein
MQQQPLHHISYKPHLSASPVVHAAGVDRNSPCTTSPSSQAFSATQGIVWWVTTTSYLQAHSDSGKLLKLLPTAFYRSAFFLLFLQNTSRIAHLSAASAAGVDSSSPFTTSASSQAFSAGPRPASS